MIEDLGVQVTGEIPRHLMYVKPIEEGSVRIYLQNSDDLEEYRSVLANLPHPQTDLKMGSIVAVYGSARRK